MGYDTYCQRVAQSAEEMKQRFTRKYKNANHMVLDGPHCVVAAADMSAHAITHYCLPAYVPNFVVTHIPYSNQHLLELSPLLAKACQEPTLENVGRLHHYMNALPSIAVARPRSRNGSWRLSLPSTTRSSSSLTT